MKNAKRRHEEDRDRERKKARGRLEAGQSETLSRTRFKHEEGLV